MPDSRALQRGLRLHSGSSPDRPRSIACRCASYRSHQYQHLFPLEGRLVTSRPHLCVLFMPQTRNRHQRTHDYDSMGSQGGRDRRAPHRINSPAQLALDTPTAERPLDARALHIIAPFIRQVHIKATQSGRGGAVETGGSRHGVTRSPHRFSTTSDLGDAVRRSSASRSSRMSSTSAAFRLYVICRP